MNSFCTIITANYFYYAKALYDSLLPYDKNLRFYVLIVDEKEIELTYKSIEVIHISTIKNDCYDDYKKLEKYEEDRICTLRWALKPLFLKYLITELNLDNAMYVDADIYFYNDFQFLFDKLKKSDVLLTPHWRSIDPKKDSYNFEDVVSRGIFNAGFFACNNKAINILDWWIEACSYKMKGTDGFFFDQGYLDLLPVYFSTQIEILEHKGCNVANWNRLICERKKGDNEVLINNKYSIIFIHFNNLTIRMIRSGKDQLLIHHLNIYSNNLLKHKSAFMFNENSDSTKNKKKNFLKRFVKKLK